MDMDRHHERQDNNKTTRQQDCGNNTGCIFVHQINSIETGIATPSFHSVPPSYSRTIPLIRLRMKRGIANGGVYLILDGQYISESLLFRGNGSLQFCSSPFPLPLPER